MSEKARSVEWFERRIKAVVAKHPKLATLNSMTLVTWILDLRHDGIRDHDDQRNYWTAFDRLREAGILHK